MNALDKLAIGVDRTKSYFRHEDPTTALKRMSYDVHAEGVRMLFSHFEPEYGVNVFERDWDVLVILDACRTDLMDEVADDYDFLEKYRTHNSVGSNSGQWMRRTFAPEYRDEMARTALVTGNPHSKTCVDGDDLLYLDEVWRYAWEDESELFRANYITDRAITAHRDLQPDRMIVHYMQPHLPFIPHFEGFETKLHETWLNQWRDVRVGKASKEVMWCQYRDNLHYVLEYVQVLLDSIDAETVVVSADHGEAVGEWGIYGHEGIPLRALREVPWIETSATDTGEYDPVFQPERTELDEPRRDVEDQLQMLGYL